MKFISQFLKQIFRSAKRSTAAARLKWRNWREPRYKTVIAAELLPKLLEARVIYIVEEDGLQEQAAMVCPCGCGAVLHMNLLRDERPCWSVSINRNGAATLHPSVWRKKYCQSHFWFRDGRVIWV